MISLKMKSVILLCFIFFSINSASQILTTCCNNKNIDVYVLTDRYGNKALNFFEQNNFIDSKLFTRSMIDPKNIGEVNLSVLENNIEELFPNKSDIGFCFIDWEEPFKEMKLHYKDEQRFNVISNKYLQIIDVFRRMRPNVKIAIYGMPFTAFKTKWDVMKVNEGGRFDKILSKCDFISPAVYIRFTNKEVGKKQNIRYIKDNLKIAFEYGNRLNKPIVPFVWPYVHPNNKKYGNQKLSIDELKFYIENLINYNYNNIHISGIIWFDSKISQQDRNNKAELNNTFKNRDNTIIEGLSDFTKKQQNMKKN